MKSSGLDAFPPALQLVIRDIPNWSGFDPVSGHKRIRQLLPDLRQQAEITLAQQLDSLAQSKANPKKPSGTFAWHLPPDLDPLSDHYKCNAPSCRIRTTQQMARLLGLYADTAYIPDRISLTIATTERWTEASSTRLIWQLHLLGEIAPLVSEGILKFAAPVLSTCSSCKEELDRRIDEATRSVIEDLASKIRFTRSRRVLAIDVSSFDEAAPVFRQVLGSADLKRLRSKEPTALEEIGKHAYGKVLREQAFETLLGTMATERLGACTLSGSRANSMIMRSLDNVVPSSQQPWEVAQATDLPWVKDLSLTQILALRNEAATALPRFRARMASAFNTPIDSREGEVCKVVNELHEEALEVQQELGNAKIGQEGRFRTLLGSVSIAVAVFGSAMDLAPASLAGLVSVLGYIHKSARDDHRDVERIQSRPGFVLLRSKEILGHAEKES